VPLISQILQSISVVVPQC